MSNNKQIQMVRKGKRRGVKRNLKQLDSKQNLDRIGSGNMRVRIQTRGLVIPDQFEQTFLYAEQQRNIFNTASTTGSETWAFTDLNAFRTGVSPTQISGFCNGGGAIGDGARMRRYRVLDVDFIVRVQNREAVNPITLCLHPAQVLPAVSSAAEFQWLMEQASSVVKTVGPLSSGKSTQVMRMKYNPEKFYGEQYHEQDEYSGGISGGIIGSPATPVYMGLSFHNTNVNTLTTGGLVLTISAKIRVLFFQPDRDEDPATFLGIEKTVESVEKQISVLESRLRALKRENSK
jgi:hypothetical protein